MRKKYESQTPGQFPIVALNLFNDKLNYTDEQNQKNLKEVCKTAVKCGFNLALQDNVTLSSIIPLLKAMEGSGLKMILGNPALMNEANCSVFVNTFKSSPTLAGWYLACCPEFLSMQNVRIRHNDILAKDPDHLIYIQLYESLSYRHTDICHSYIDYLRYVQGCSFYVDRNEDGIKDDIIRQPEAKSGVKPMIWSNDFDPVKFTHSGDIKPLYPSFYLNLRYLRQISLESGQPFWAFCQCEKVATSDGYKRGILPIMRLMCYSALAYGAQGLIFSSYFQRPNGSGQIISESPMDSDGNKTEQWYTVRSLIAEIRSFTHIFLGGQPVNIRNLGKLGIEQFNYGTGDAFGPCESITAPDSGFLCVLYKNKHRNYLIVVNQDIRVPQFVTLKFNKMWKIVEETPIKVFMPQNLTEFQADCLFVKRYVSPGDWLIFRYE